VLRVIQAAQGRFDDLRLHTSNPEAARLYEALGFRPSSEGVDHTHVAKVAVLLSLADPKALVRESYNRIAADYLLSRRRDSSDIALVDDLLARLPPRARVLDAGCGAGVPIAHRLAARVRVVGVDFAEVQLGFARRHVSSGLWVCADLAALPFAGASFDAVCSHYAVIHIPRDQHAGVLEGFARVLRPGGLALLCLGAADLPAWTEQYHGTPMYWSHYDAATSLSLVEAAGFEPVWHRRVADGPASHLFVLARRRDPGDR
jgi:SAM-dependent methyltransferase